MERRFNLRFLLIISVCFFSSGAQAAPAKKNSLAYQHYTRGVEQSSKKKFEEALKSFQSAIDLNPAYVASYIEYARTAALLNRRKSALEKLTAALEFSKGREEREKVLAERDNLSEIFYTNATFQNYQNGLNYLRLERTGAAIDALERARKVEPDNLLILLAYAKALELEERTKEAQELLEAGFSLNDRNREIRLELSEIFLVKNPEKSIALLKPVLGNTSDERIPLLQARALSGTKRNKEAIDFLRERSDKQPDWLLSHFWLGKFYSAESDGGWNARKHLMTFLKRTEPLEINAKEDSLSPDQKDLKTLKIEAEGLLSRVNKSLK